MVAGGVEDDGVDFLGVADEDEFGCAGWEVPDADCAVVGAGDEGASAGGECADGVVVAFEEGVVVWVLGGVLEWGICEKGKGKRGGTYADLGNVDLRLTGTKAGVLWVCRAR